MFLDVVCWSFIERSETIINHLGVKSYQAAPHAVFPDSGFITSFQTSYLAGAFWENN